ncbi:hypothetical protein [Flagellimonas nanhaiensis]|uniref:hypothetical protein n=1 Tax=Flagellimonas nanhaiensis TaxID=2292706 RepID=UPI0015F267FC|nr:hypothetical protein [Allomuricauda nanhaiensis]
MKKTLTTLLLLPLYLFMFLCCLSAQAQLHIDLEVANKTNEVFGPLDKSKIPHSMLLDYGYDFVDVTNYDGVLRDNNYIVPSTYRDLYNSVVSMRTSLVVPELVDPVALEQDWKSMAKSHAAKFGKKPFTTAITLNGLYYHYSRIRPDALDLGLIEVVDDKYYKDVYENTQWKNPYETLEVFAITLPQTRISSSTISLLLEDTEWRTNQATLVQSFEVDFGDGGGFHPYELGETLEHQFTEDGDYVWTFRLKLTDNTFRYCRTPVKITGKATRQTLTARNPACVDEPWEETITASKAYMGVKGVAKLQIAPAKECKKIHKPLIVVEGFDTGLLSEIDKVGDMDIGTFLKGVDKSDNDKLKDLITEDTEESFDIIYVNWDNGTDWLQRNAYVLEEVIRWVNQTKENDAAPNVILGQSMGGVLARYALRDMENNNEDHDTSLYVSHDAPHQGAHVPPGALYMVRHVLNELITTPVGDILVAMASGEVPVHEARKLIDQPAVRQLLINWVDVNYKINKEEHEAWQNELKAMGYPQQTRNIALSNGSHCAQTYGIQPGQTLARLNGTGSTKLFGDFISFIAPVVGGSIGVAFGDIPTILLGFLPGQAKLKTDFHIWAFPGGEEGWLYKGWIQYEKKNLWVLPITRTITNKTVTFPGETLRLDDFPGGAMPFIGTIDEFDEYESNVLASYNLSLETTPDINFIPVTSALDVGSGNAQLTIADYLNIYSVESPPSPDLAIPFHNYATTYNVTGHNAEHISFNRQNGDWLANEFNKMATSFDCSFLCESSEIEGNKLLCEEELYFVEVKGDTEVQWSSSNPDAAMPTDPNSPATSFITPPNSFSQQITITATLTSEACGGDPVVLEKVLQVGRPSQPSNLYGPEVVLTGALVSYFGGPAVGADSYEWRLPYPFDRVNQFDIFGNNWQIKKTATSYQSAHVFTGYGKDNGYVQLMGINDCGAGPARLLWVKHAGPGDGGGGGGIPIQPDTDLDIVPGTSDESDGVIIYPNIASEEVNIAIAPLQSPDIEVPSRILGVTLYAQLQQIPKKSLTFQYPGELSVTVDVRDLTTGYYAVIIETNLGPVYKILLVD